MPLLDAGVQPVQQLLAGGTGQLAVEAFGIRLAVGRRGREGPGETGGGRVGRAERRFA
nr:hypothetical protein [Nocardia gipuzkoensis]